MHCLGKRIETIAMNFIFLWKFQETKVHSIVLLTFSFVKQGLCNFFYGKLPAAGADVFRGLGSLSFFSRAQNDTTKSLGNRKQHVQ